MCYFCTFLFHFLSRSPNIVLTMRAICRASRLYRRRHFSSVVPTTESSTLVDKVLGKLQKTFLPHYGPLDPIVLYDAQRCDEFWEDDWMSTSDRSYGGPSHTKLTYAVDTPSTKKGEDVSNSDLHSDSQGNSTFHGFPFMRFEGSLDMSTRKSKELGVSGGFCAIRCVQRRCC